MLYLYFTWIMWHLTVEWYNVLSPQTDIFFEKVYKHPFTIISEYFFSVWFSNTRIEHILIPKRILSSKHKWRIYEGIREKEN